MLFALTAIPFFAAGGIALDYGRAAYAKSTIQSAADAAVLSAANVLVSDANRTSVAASVFVANLKSNGFVNGVTPTTTFVNGVVNVSATFQAPTSLTKLIGHNQIPVAVSSQAAVGKTYGSNPTAACVIALSKTAEDAFMLNGTPQFEALNCSVYTNSNATRAIRSVGASSALADLFCTRGGYDVNDTFYPIPTTGCSEFPDPFSKLVPPASTACDPSAKATVIKKGEHSLPPGTYCGGLDLMAQANVTFEPGVFIIKGGPLIFRSGSASTGTGVSFYLTGTDAQLIVNGGADADLTATTSGPLAGIIAAQDATANPGATSKVLGGGVIRIVGALYFPTQNFQVGGNGDVGQSSTAWAIVADTVELNGTGNIRIQGDFTAAGLPNVVALPSSLGPRIMY
jgi:hypothetical protein